MSTERSIRQPYLSIIAKNGNAQDKEKFLQIIRETLQKVADTGVNKDSCKGCVKTLWSLSSVKLITAVSQAGLCMESR